MSTFFYPKIEIAPNKLWFGTDSLCETCLHVVLYILVFKAKCFNAKSCKPYHCLLQTEPNHWNETLLDVDTIECVHGGHVGGAKPLKTFAEKKLFSRGKSFYCLASHIWPP